MFTFLFLNADNPDHDANVKNCQMALDNWQNNPNGSTDGISHINVTKADIGNIKPGAQVEVVTCQESDTANPETICRINAPEGTYDLPDQTDACCDLMFASEFNNDEPVNDSQIAEFKGKYPVCSNTNFDKLRQDFRGEKNNSVAQDNSVVQDRFLGCGKRCKAAFRVVVEVAPVVAAVAVAVIGAKK